MQHTNTSSKRSRSTIGLFYRDLGARRGALKGTRTGRTSRDFSLPARCRTDRILFRFLCDLPTADAEKIRSERLGEKPVTTVAALGQGNARRGRHPPSLVRAPTRSARTRLARRDNATRHTSTCLVHFSTTCHSCHFRTSSRSPLGPRLKLRTSDEQSVSHGELRKCRMVRMAHPGPALLIAPCIHNMFNRAFYSN